MLKRLLSLLVPAAVLAAAAPAAAQTFTVTSASRQVRSYAYVYDSFWRDSGSVTDQESSNLLGDFDETAAAATSGRFQWADGDAYQVSDITNQAIWSEIYADSRALDYDAGTARSDNRGSFSASFTVPSRVRVAFSGELGAWGSNPSPIIDGAITLAGPGGVMFTRTLDDYGGDDGSLYGFLQPGTYTINASTRAELTASIYPDEYEEDGETAFSYLIFYLHTHCVADYDVDDNVDAWDLQWYTQAHAAGQDDADVDGDGDVDGDDLAAFQAAYTAGC